MNSDFVIQKQRDASESAAICLTAVANHLGVHPSSNIFSRLSNESNEISMLEIIEAANSMGFEGEGYRIPLESWNEVGFPVIMNVISPNTLQPTFVVCIGADENNNPQIADPETGKVSTYSLQKLNEVWLTRTCIAFEYPGSSNV